MIVYVIQKFGGNENYPNDLNEMVNYHYEVKTRVINWQLSSMPRATKVRADGKISNDFFVYLYNIRALVWCDQGFWKLTRMLLAKCN